tara:strand:+ start:6305 stop:8170 length:1866 start_codon:yes stop_codon:yes gene_type:complete
MNKLLIFILLMVLIGATQDNKDTLEKIQSQALLIKNKKNNPAEKKFLQAKSLERAGLYEEAFYLFKEINQDHPGQSKYFRPLKNHLKQIGSFDSLLVYTKQYIESSNYNFQSQLELLEVYIWMDKKEEWQNIALQLTLDAKENQNAMKSILQHLINNAKYDFAYELINNYRKKINKKDFYSLEMGTFYGMRMSYNKATKEYLLFLEEHPNQLQTISNRIMAFPSEKNINKEITNILSNSSLKIAKFLLADFQFKQKNYKQGYKVLKDNQASPQILLDYAKDLAAINELMMAEEVLTDIIDANINEVIITQSIFELAKIFESKMIITSINLPLSGFYPHNTFFTSPYLPIKEEASVGISSAMEIYDSLRVSKKNAQAAYRLAEIQFRILGDLDGAHYLYQEAYKHGNSQGLRKDAGVGMINIQIAKGNLEKAIFICTELQKTYPQILEYKIKEAQIQFYKGQFDIVDNSLRSIIETLPLDHPIYNDVLNVLSILIGFRHNQEDFQIFAEAQLNIQQNKRTEAMEKLLTLYNSKEIYIEDMCRYQNAWLNFLQKDFEKVTLELQSIKHKTIFKEMAHILTAEILDYIDNNIEQAITNYLNFLELYPNSIYYDDIRLRLRELAS